jgi:RNA polymerase sigma-70 factor (ECF subfamily)
VNSSAPGKEGPAAPLDDRDRADLFRLADGNDTALNDLMGRHGPKLYNYLLRSLQNEDDAADLAQETFARVYQSRAKFDPNQKFSIWLYAIASNLIRTQFRYRTRHPQISLDAEQPDTGKAFCETIPQDGPNPGETLETVETADAVRQAIAALPEDLRTPLILSEYQDLSYSDIGEILNCSPKAVESRLYRARKLLRQQLSKWLSLA